MTKLGWLVPLTRCWFILDFLCFPVTFIKRWNLQSLSWLSIRVIAIHGYSCVFWSTVHSFEMNDVWSASECCGHFLTQISVIIFVTKFERLFGILQTWQFEARFGGLSGEVLGMKLCFQVGFLPPDFSWNPPNTPPHLPSSSRPWISLSDLRG